jgi:hypothetical protein
MSDSSLNMLLDFERVLDNVDIYTFPNWSKGELVDGPKISKYFVSCKFMWPYRRMPDPSGGYRLLPYGVKINYSTTEIQIPAKIKSSDDYRAGTHKGKLIPVKVWIVEILMPKNLMKNIKQGYREIAGEEIDLSDLSMAYEKDLQDKALTQQPQQQQQLPVEGVPNAPTF